MDRRLRLPAVIAAVLAALPAAAAAQDEWITVDTVYLSEGTPKDTTYVTLAWTAPAAWDDWNWVYVPVTSYDLRMSTTGPVTEGTWGDAQPSDEDPTPQPAGTYQTHQVNGLRQGTTYWFAIRAYAGSAAGYLPSYPGFSTTTLTDSIPPATIDSLAVSSPGESQFTLTWAAPGDDGVIGKVTVYNLRYSSVGPIVTQDDFAAATPVVKWIVPLAANSPQTAEVWPLTPATTYWFAVRAADEVGNLSPLSANSPSGTTLAEEDGHSGGMGCGGSGTGRWIGPMSLALLPALPILIRRRASS